MKSFVMTISTLGLFALTSCVTPTPPSPTIVTKIRVIHICPSVVNYSNQDYTSLEQEVSATPNISMIDRWLDDYVRLRSKIEACRNRFYNR